MSAVAHLCPEPGILCRAAGIVATTNVEEACKDVDVAVMIGGFPRKAGMERKDVMAKNVTIYKNQASALEKFASKDVKVLIVANPANTNAIILKEYAPSIPAKNITCMTRLDHNRALAQVSGQGTLQHPGSTNPHTFSCTLTSALLDLTAQTILHATCLCTPATHANQATSLLPPAIQHACPSAHSCPHLHHPHLHHPHLHHA
jgi:hypothetical protein